MDQVQQHQLVDYGIAPELQEGDLDLEPATPSPVAGAMDLPEGEDEGVDAHAAAAAAVVVPPGVHPMPGYLPPYYMPYYPYHVSGMPIAPPPGVAGHPGHTNPYAAYVPMPTAAAGMYAPIPYPAPPPPGAQPPAPVMQHTQTSNAKVRKAMAAAAAAAAAAEDGAEVPRPEPEGDTGADGRPKKSQVIACYSCKEKKLRCDQGRPKCTNCGTRHLECHYPDTIRRRGPGKKKKNASLQGAPTEDPGTVILEHPGAAYGHEEASQQLPPATFYRHGVAVAPQQARSKKKKEAAQAVDASVSPVVPLEEEGEQQTYEDEQDPSREYHYEHVYPGMQPHPHIVFAAPVIPPEDQQAEDENAVAVPHGIDYVTQQIVLQPATVAAAASSSPDASGSAPSKRKRGRPKGSLNKNSKPWTATLAAEEDEDDFSPPSEQEDGDDDDYGAPRKKRKAAVAADPAAAAARGRGGGATGRRGSPRKPVDHEQGGPAAAEYVTAPAEVGVGA